MEVDSILETSGLNPTLQEMYPICLVRVCSLRTYSGTILEIASVFVNKTPFRTFLATPLGT